MNFKGTAGEQGEVIAETDVWAGYGELGLTLIPESGSVLGPRFTIRIVCPR